MIQFNSLLSKKNFSLCELNFSLFLSTVSFGMICFYSLGRIGFDTSYYDINNIIGISFFLILSPLIFQFIFNKSEKTTYTIGLTGILSFAAFILMIIISFVIPHIGYWLLAVFVSLGYVFFIVTLFLFFKNQRWYVSMVILFLSALFILWLFGRVYSSYLSPLAFENLVLGISTLDTFYHSSIMEMIKTFGIPSTGLNGTPYLAYHWGSHWILARFAILLNVSSITIYNLVYPSLFICLFFKSLLSFAHDLFCMSTKDVDRNINPGITFWIVFIIIHVGFLPTPFLRQWAVWESWIESESYTLSLFYFFVMCSAVLYVYNKNFGKQPSKYSLYFLPLAIALPLLGLIKISLLVVAVTVLVYMFLKLHLFRSGINVLFITLILVLSFFILRITASTYTTNQENDNFQLFHFIKTYTLSDWRGFFYYVHYFYTILYLFLRLKDLKINETNFKNYFVTNKLLDVEILIVISLVGLLPASLFRIDGGSAYYFTDIQTRVSAAFLLAYLLRDQLYEKRFLSFTKSIALILPAVLLMSISNIFSKFENAININLATRITLSQLYSGEANYIKSAPANILNYISGGAKDILPKLKELSSIPSKGLENNEKYAFITKLAKLAKLDSDQKRSTMIYVPRSNEWFWKGMMRDPSAIAFTIPALTGMSSIGGLPESVDHYLYINYGFHTYKNEFSDYTNTQPSRDSICSESIVSKTILVVNSMVQIDTLVCK